ncbi:MAG: hypothetical protein HOO97_07855 [Sideroxydans sp.]|nr:hypothetical protein [Sideroxydans sp.]
MRTSIGCGVVLLSVLGNVTEAAGVSEAVLAGNRGLSPMEMMFIMDVPSIPAQQTPIVLAQATTPAASATPQPDFILKTCVETESTGDPMSAMRGVDPAGLLAVYLQNYDKRIVDMAMLAAIKTTLLQGTQHGKIFSEIDNDGLTSYHYDPTPNYIGNDRAVFLAEFEGKVYKIVLNLVVSLQVNENPLMEGQQPVCPPPKLIKVTKPSTGYSGDPKNGGAKNGVRYRLESQVLVLRN